jgi:hypothetical protein
MLHMNGKVTREIEFAIHELASGKYASALRRLCYVRGVPVPELKRPRSRAVGGGALSGGPREGHSVSQAPGVAVPPHERPDVAVQRDREPVTPLPKPTKRHVDRDLLAEFRAKFPTCCLQDCVQPAHPHHLVSRSDGGSDAHENLAPLCFLHHIGVEGWHTLTPAIWIAKYAGRLPELVRQKIRLSQLMQAIHDGARDAVEDG